MQSITETATLPELAEQITHEHAKACNAARSALEHARRAGDLLIRAKRQTRHGAWLPWLNEHFEFTARTAQSYMQIAERWGELEAKSETVSHLSLREALALLAPTKPLEVHEYGAIFPPMTEAEFDGLKESISTLGLREKITLYNGQVLDGKERLRACDAVGVVPEFENFEGDSEAALSFVLSRNLYRQHLTEGQRAAIAVELTASEAASVC